MKIEIHELLPEDVVFARLPFEVQGNLFILCHALNYVRALFGQPMVISSGYRTLEHHEEIYREKNEKRMQAGQKPVPVPLGSWHLCGAAADVLSDEFFKRWVLDHLHVLEELGLYCEDFDSTPGWVHFQIYPPASAKRFFLP